MDRILQVIGRSKSARPAQTEKVDGVLVDGIVLYDVTNTHFEGLCAKNPKARHGKNKQKRSDCRQGAIGMAFDERGLPLAHEVFEGNMSDGKTLIHILDRLGADTGVTSGKDAPEKPLVILDAGFASKANLALLKERGEDPACHRAA